MNILIQILKKVCKKKYSFRLRISQIKDITDNYLIWTNQEKNV